MQLTKKAKIAIISAAAAVAVAIAVIVPVVVVCTRDSGDPVNQYTVTFDSRGGSAVQSITLNEGVAVIKPSDPTQDWFIFDGWFTDTAYVNEFEFGTAMPSHDITLYACWAPSEARIEIKYNANGGVFENESTVKVESGKVGDAFSATANPSRYGYSFGGWFIDAECLRPLNISTYPAESFEAYAYWEHDNANFAYVTFYGNGVKLKEVPVEKGGAMPEYTFDADEYKSDIVFDKWYINATLTQENTIQTVNSNINLYTSYYTDGLVIDGNEVKGYNGTSSTVYVPSIYNGKGVTVIGANAFYRSSNFNDTYGHITEIVLPETITTLSNNAFYDCRYLETINLSNRLRTIGDNAFWHNERLKDFGDISNVTSIGNGAFTGCSVLRNITLPATLTSLGAYAFADCIELREIVVPSNIAVIGEYAFDGCKQLAKVELNSTSLNSIGAYAFRNCSALESIIVRSDKLVEFGIVKIGNHPYSPFAGCSNVKISVKSTLVEGYKGAYGDCDDGTLANKFTGI